MDTIRNWEIGEIGMKYSVSIDVPLLDEGLRFYCDALGLPEIARPVPTYVILKCGASQIGLIEKSAGSNPAKGTNDFETFLAKAIIAGAKCEQKFEGVLRPPIAFCSDPFGNGFCVVGTN